MPRPKRVPAYSLHKPSGQARVILNGRHTYLGRLGSPESREKYGRLIAERFASGGQGTKDSAGVPPDGPARYPDLSVNELLVRYLTFAEGYYTSDGKPTGEVGNLKDAMRPLRALYGLSRANSFGPRSLKAVRQHMINSEGLSRKVVNGRIDRLKRVFKWAASEELIPPAVYDGLRTVAGLRYGRSNARETDPVRPVAEEAVRATLRFLPPQVADMVRVQLATGMRSANLVSMRLRDIDRTDSVWIYEPARHKTQFQGKRLRILIGPQAQAVLGPYLNRPPDAYLFSPVEVQAWRAEQQRREPKDRKTPLYPSELRRLRRLEQASRRRRRKRPQGSHYTTDSYRRAIAYGIDKANEAGVVVPHWHPHQLRHARATEVRKRFGVEGAQLVLGHAKANITEVYAERDMEFARRIARKTGWSGGGRYLSTAAPHDCRSAAAHPPAPGSPGGRVDGAAVQSASAANAFRVRWRGRGAGDNAAGARARRSPSRRGTYVIVSGPDRCRGVPCRSGTIPQTRTRHPRRGGGSRITESR